MIGILGGAFDPPHNGHVALAEAAKKRFDLDKLIVAVVADPGHKDVATPVDIRLQLARAAFPNDEVVVERERYTVDAVRGGRYGDAIFLIGADEFCDFATWKEPDEVLEWVRLGVATRPGFPRGRIESVLATLQRPDRVEFFDIPEVPVASRDLRGGGSLDASVPPAVAALVETLGLYRDPRLH